MKIMTYNVQTGTPTPTRAANMLNNILDYDADICRNISVDIRYVLFVIDKIGGAGYLIDEMTLD